MRNNENSKSIRKGNGSKRKKSAGKRSWANLDGKSDTYPRKTTESFPLLGHPGIR
jgi:hypothetical protein